MGHKRTKYRKMALRQAGREPWERQSAWGRDTYIYIYIFMGGIERSPKQKAVAETQRKLRECM